MINSADTKRHVCRAIFLTVSCRIVDLSLLYNNDNGRTRWLTTVRTHPSGHTRRRTPKSRVNAERHNTVSALDARPKRCISW